MKETDKNPKDDLENTEASQHVRQQRSKAHVKTTENASRQDIIDKNTNQKPRDDI